MDRQPHILNDLLEQFAAVTLKSIEHAITLSEVKIGPRLIVTSCIMLLILMIL